MLAPPPWELRATAYLFAVKSDPEEPFARFPGLSDRRMGPVSFALFVDYSESPVGPYRELLYIPGTFRFGSEYLPSISKIYVSTQASIDNGRRNWSIPKELAAFDVHYGAGGVDSIAMQVGSAAAVALAFEPRKLRIPTTTALLPQRLRSLGQRLDGRTLVTRPRGRGMLAYARVREAWSDPQYFPSLSSERIVGAAKLSDVKLRFPEPEPR